MYVCSHIKYYNVTYYVQLFRLQAAAVSTLNEWKEQSAAGLQHLAETRGEIDLQLDLIAPYILIPRGGVLNP